MVNWTLASKNHILACKSLETQAILAWRNSWLQISDLLRIICVCHFFLKISKQTRNENEGETVEQLEKKQDEKDKQEVEKGKQVKTMLWKFRVEWKQLYPWLDYKDGKMFCLWCCEYGNLSNASSSFVTGGCTNLKINMLWSHYISTSHDNVVKACRAQKKPSSCPFSKRCPDCVWGGSKQIQNVVWDCLLMKISVDLKWNTVWT